MFQTLRVAPTLSIPEVYKLNGWFDEKTEWLKLIDQTAFQVTFLQKTTSHSWSGKSKCQARVK